MWKPSWRGKRFWARNTSTYIRSARYDFGSGGEKVLERSGGSGLLLLSSVNVSRCKILKGGPESPFLYVTYLCLTWATWKTYDILIWTEFNEALILKFKIFLFYIIIYLPRSALYYYYSTPTVPLALVFHVSFDQDEKYPSLVQLPATPPRITTTFRGSSFRKVTPLSHLHQHPGDCWGNVL